MLGWGCLPVQNNNGGLLTVGVSLVTCGKSAVKIICGPSSVQYSFHKTKEISGLCILPYHGGSW